MTTTSNITPGETGTHVDTAIATLRSELARSDSKASLLLALTGAGLAALVSVAADKTLPAAVLAVGALGAAALLGATVVLLLAVRPNLAGRGWPSWPSLSEPELADRLAQGQHLAEVQALSQAARTKFVRIRLAVDLVLLGLGFLAVAAALAAAL